MASHVSGSGRQQPADGAVGRATPAEMSRDLYRRIGAFLDNHRLGADPVTYSFVYRVLNEPQGPLARAVAGLVDGGVRLTVADIASLGGSVGGSVGGAPPAAPAGDEWVARAQLQIEGVEHIVRTVQAEANAFATTIAAGADALSEVRDVSPVTEIVAVARAMVARTRAAEARLDDATREAQVLRCALEEARADAQRDPLTALPNRRALEEHYRPPGETGPALCLAMCDIDHFKQVNDRFGHAVGDRVLRAIATALSAVCVDHLVTRYGGEEFAVLFTGVSLAEAEALLDRARASVAGKRYLLRESDAPLGAITFSAGLTLAGAGEALGTVLGRADRLLYAAKAAGRNRVHAAATEIANR
ncbi:diguanylate cyclase [Hephaestia sp. GCM10023244]|uniref:GGDEF domain-containing protein n=1 Tax=unclassified Hephaestia TaxID=2631281 RepID=UPI002076D792|nr:GGDEF domain-containing protein [Hephaestia sp. MAHUQ-44]MCM8730980.1 GGDEF domain-containing protein [Hephaestia sp. MAHUQ-44]